MYFYKLKQILVFLSPINSKCWLDRFYHNNRIIFGWIINYSYDHSCDIKEMVVNILISALNGIFYFFYLLMFRLFYLGIFLNILFVSFWFLILTGFFLTCLFFLFRMTFPSLIQFFLSRGQEIIAANFINPFAIYL